MNKNRHLQNRTKKKRLSIVVTILCLAVFIYSLYQLSSIFMTYSHNRQVLADVQQIYHEESDVVKEVDSKEGEIRPQFNQLRQINPDILGWISIDDTKINYPILQSADNEFYLDRNYKKEDSIAGSIFMDYRNDITLTNPNTIIYGHRVKDNSMFDSLTNYLDEHFFNNHQLIYYDTMYESYQAEVFAVYQTTTDFDYIQTDFSDGQEYDALLKEIQERSIYDTNVDLTMNDQIITLSTCDYTLDPDEGRLVVHAKLVKKE